MGYRSFELPSYEYEYEYDVPIASRADEFSLEQCPRHTVRHLFAESDAHFKSIISARDAEASAEANEQLAKKAQRLQLFARRLVPVFIHFGKHTSSSTLRCASRPRFQKRTIAFGLFAPFFNFQKARIANEYDCEYDYE